MSSTTERKRDAQDAIVDMIVGLALTTDESGEPQKAEAIRVQGARVAKFFGLSDVPGLPATFPEGTLAQTEPITSAL